MYQKMSKKELIELLEVKEKSRIRDQYGVVELLKKYRGLSQEYFVVLTLNGANKPIKVHEITKGSLNRTIIHPREIFKVAVMDSAASIVICHNHPSGEVDPSQEDKDVTKRIKSAGEIMGIPLLDHIILGVGDTYSFAEHNGI